MYPENYSVVLTALAGGVAKQNICSVWLLFEPLTLLSHKQQVGDQQNSNGEDAGDNGHNCGSYDSHHQASLAACFVLAAPRIPIYAGA